MHHQLHVIQGDVGEGDAGLPSETIAGDSDGFVGHHIGLAGVQLAAGDGDLGVLLDAGAFALVALAVAVGVTPHGVDAQHAFQSAGDLEGGRAGAVGRMPEPVAEMTVVAIFTRLRPALVL